MNTLIEQNPALSILIVDDVPSAREVLKDMVYELGFTTVHEASDGSEATKILDNESVNLVLCDQVMHDMSGRDLLVHIRQSIKNRTLPVIFVSALSDVAEVDEALKLEATDYLIKPVSFRKLRRKIEDALHSSKSKIELAAG